MQKKQKEIKELKKINKQQFLNYEAKIDKMEYEMGYEYISKDKIRESLEKLKEKEQELSDEQGYWGSSELQARIEELEQLLEG